MEIRIADILVGNRIRRLNPDKVTELVESIRLIGLLQDIVVAKSGDRYILVAGWHRLEACKRLGQETIGATVLELDDVQRVLAEIDENLRRSDLTVLDRAEHLKKREELLVALQRRAKAGDNQFNGGGGATVAPPPKTTSDIATEMGVAERSVQVRLQIATNIVDDVKDALRGTGAENSMNALVSIARLSKEKQQKVAGYIMAGKKAKDAVRRATRDAKRAVPLSKDKYRVFYADPPLPYGNSGMDAYGPAERHYDTMSTDELGEFGARVRKISAKDAVLFLWSPIPMVPDALIIGKAWGFSYKGMYIWDKVLYNFGNYNSVRAELLLIFTRGSCTPDVDKKFDDVVSIERSRKHSEKPEEFRKIIDTLYPRGKRIELFARKRVKGWDAYGDQFPPEESGDDPTANTATATRAGQAWHPRRRVAVRSNRRRPDPALRQVA